MERERERGRRIKNCKSREISSLSQLERKIHIPFHSWIDKFDYFHARTMINSSSIIWYCFNCTVSGTSLRGERRLKLSMEHETNFWLQITSHAKWKKPQWAPPIKAVNLEVYLVLNTFLCRLVVYANIAAKWEEKWMETEERARAILEMSDEVWRVFPESFAFRNEIKINVMALNVLQTNFIEFQSRHQPIPALVAFSSACHLKFATSERGKVEFH